MKKDNKAYDFTKKNKAGVSASLRGMVSLYLVYMAWNLAKTARDPGNTLPIWGAWLAAAVFAGVAALFGLYAWRRYKEDLAEAELSPDELEKLEDPAGELPEADSPEDGREDRA